MECRKGETIGETVASREHGMTSLYKPVSRECWNNPSSDCGDQGNNSNNREPPAKPGGQLNAGDFQMHHQIGDREHRDRDGHH